MQNAISRRDVLIGGSVPRYLSSHLSSAAWYMSTKISLLLTLIFLVNSSVVFADNADQYSKCQDACFGNGLSCVKKCLGDSGGPAGNSASNPTPPQGGDSAVVVEVDDGDNAYLPNDPAVRRRVREDRQELEGDGTGSGATNGGVPVRRPGGFGRR